MRAQQKGDMFAVVWIRHLESFFVRFKKIGASLHTTYQTNKPLSMHA